MKSGLYYLIGWLMLLSLLPGCSPKIEKIRVATDATWPPWEYFDETNTTIKGFDIDLFNAIAGKENLQVEFIHADLSQLLAGIAQCQYDVAISSLSITEERKKDMLFSDPYLEAGQQVAVRIENADITDKASLRGKVIGTQNGTAGAFEVQAINGAVLKIYNNIEPAFRDLIDGQIEAVIADRIICSWYVRKNRDKLKTINDIFNTEYGGIAVCKAKPHLLEKINHGLKAAREEGIIDNLVEKWFITPQSDNTILENQP
jgi:polar amino acid transport system substrate-binding protein